MKGGKGGGQKSWKETQCVERPSLPLSCHSVNFTLAGTQGCVVMRLAFIIYHRRCRLLLLSLAFAETRRHRGGFDLAWECSRLCGPCESFSLSHICFCCSVISTSLSLFPIISLCCCFLSFFIPPSEFFSLPPLSSIFPSTPPGFSPLFFSFSLLSSQIYCIENAHGQLVRDLDFNPNRQYYLASCGDDCKVKFWDVRNVQEPVKTLEEHSHWWVDWWWWWWWWCGGLERFRPGCV